MSLTKSLIAEIQHEANKTKEILERIPAEKFDWQPHQKSLKLKNLAVHIVGLAEFPELIVKTEELDLAAGTLKAPEINSTDDLVRVLQDKVSKSIASLTEIDNEELKKEWVFRAGDREIARLPKSVAIRNIALNHVYHHRGQLSVYLRLLDVPVPGLYGPSADERS